MMDLTEKLDLTELGSRYSHYMELRDAFAAGVEIMKNALEFHSSESDTKRMNNLQNAVTLINKRVEFLADYEKTASQFSAFARDICDLPAIPPDDPRLPEVSDEVRKECEREMKRSRERDYRTDLDAIKKNQKNTKGSTEDYSTGAGESPDEPVGA
jgi:hypothetical protein